MQPLTHQNPPLAATQLDAGSAATAIGAPSKGLDFEVILEQLSVGHEPELHVVESPLLEPVNDASTSEDAEVEAEHPVDSNEEGSDVERSDVSIVESEDDEKQPIQIGQSAGAPPHDPRQQPLRDTGVAFAAGTPQPRNSDEYRIPVAIEYVANSGSPVERGAFALGAGPSDPATLTSMIYSHSSSPLMQAAVGRYVSTNTESDTAVASGARQAIDGALSDPVIPNGMGDRSKTEGSLSRPDLKTNSPGSGRISIPFEQTNAEGSSEGTRPATGFSRAQVDDLETGLTRPGFSNRVASHSPSVAAGQSSVHALSPSHLTDTSQARLLQQPDPRAFGLRGDVAASAGGSEPLSHKRSDRPDFVKATPIPAVASTQIYAAGSREGAGGQPLGQHALGDPLPKVRSFSGAEATGVADRTDRPTLADQVLTPHRQTTPYSPAAQIAVNQAPRVPSAAPWSVAPPEDVRTHHPIALHSPNVSSAEITAISEGQTDLEVPVHMWAGLESDGDHFTRAEMNGPRVVGEVTVPRLDSPRPALSQMIELAAQNQNRSVEISLNPEELGRVRMVLATSESGVVVSIAADRPETQDLMRRNLDLLSTELRRLGYESVSFEFSGGGSGTRNNDHSPHAMASDHGGEPDEIATLNPVQKPAPSGLDLRM